jgi:hypothetical protein
MVRYPARASEKRNTNEDQRAALRGIVPECPGEVPRLSVHRLGQNHVNLPPGSSRGGERAVKLDGVSRPTGIYQWCGASSLYRQARMLNDSLPPTPGRR